MGNCLNLGLSLTACCRRFDNESIPILILGLKNSGKTEVAYRLMNKKREERMATNGCRTYNSKLQNRTVKVTELGGEEFYDIWKYYFLDVYGVIYVIDASDHCQLDRSKEIFGAIMSNDLLTGKPMLVIANKQDLPGALDSLDICDYFEVEYLANLFRTPCLVEGLGKYNDQYDSQATIHTCNWLVKTILENQKTIQNKIRFLRYFTQNESISSNEEIPRQYRRPVTGKRKKKIRFSNNRPKTAPNGKPSVSSVTSSTLRTKKNSSNQVSPLVDSNFPKRFNYGEVACERGIHEFRTGIINGVITVSEITEKSYVLDKVIVEDLSLVTQYPVAEAVIS